MLREPSAYHDQSIRLYKKAIGLVRKSINCMAHDVSIPAALIAGVISFLSPCVLPLVPPYLIYLTGATIEHVASDEEKSSSKRAVMTSALLFVLGFSTVFVALGASASLIGSLVREWSAQLSIVAGIVIIIMGLHFLGLTRIAFLMREGRVSIPKPVGLWGAYVMGGSHLRLAGPHVSVPFSPPFCQSQPLKRRSPREPGCWRYIPQGSGFRFCWLRL
jgi:cytochrome c biogenesis protein CcdA